MARIESEREDLIAQATALQTRIELRIPGEAEPIVVGMRSNGWLSCYFGSDPVYHFDAAGRLRRAFVGEALFRSEGDTLSRLVRHRPAENISALLSSELGVESRDAFLREAERRIGGVCVALDAEAGTVLRQVPSETQVLPTLQVALRNTLPLRLAAPVSKRRSVGRSDADAL